MRNIQKNVLTARRRGAASSSPSSCQFLTFELPAPHFPFFTIKMVFNFILE